MMIERNFYVICDDNCRFEGMTAEEIINAIQEAVEEHGTRQIRKIDVSQIREINKNKPVQLWVGTESDYEEIQHSDDVIYIISEHHDAKQSIMSSIEEVFDDIEIISEKKETLIEELASLSASFDADIPRRMRQKESIQSADNSIQSISDSFSVATKMQEEEFAPALTVYDEEATELEDELETYQHDRDEIKTLWTGNQTIANSGYEFVLDNGWQNYSNIIIIVGYYRYNLTVKSISVYKNYGETRTVNGKIPHGIVSPATYTRTTIEFKQNGNIHVKATNAGSWERVYAIYGEGAVDDGNS